MKNITEKDANVKSQEALIVNQENIPTELKELPQWVNWKKKDKCPVNPKTGRNALSNNDLTWAAYEDSVNHMNAHKGNGIGGIGFMFSKDDDYAGIDFDHCFKDGAISKEVDTILKDLNTYCEVSPSGDGIHAIVKGKLPGPGLGPEKGRLCEMYDQGRYFTVTGRWLGQYGGRIESRKDELHSLYGKMSGGNGAGTASNVISIKEGVSDGERNKSCASVAGHYLGKGYPASEVLARCLEWNQKNTPPLPDKDIEKTVASIVRKDGRKSAAILKELTSIGLDHEKVIECLYSNEDGDARLYQYLYRDKFIFDHAAALWAEWQGHYWQEDETENAYKAIEKVVELYRNALTFERKTEKKLAQKIQESTDRKVAEDLSIKHLQCQETQKQLNKRIMTLESASRKRNVLWLAGIGTGLTGREWDKDPWLLGCSNGVIDLEAGTLRPGKQEDYIKTVTNIEFDAKAKCPKWEEFLKASFDHNNDLVAYVQRLFGYGITGLREEHKLPILWGNGRNGKGTFVETIKGVMGDLAHKTKAESLLDNGKLKASGTADADTMAFRGKRLIWASETNEGGRMNVGKIKELVGGDTLNARAPYARRSVEFEPTHLLCLITNAKPYAPASDYALWDRVALIPFALSFVDEPKAETHERKVNKKLPEELKKELPGILNWLVKGCLLWQLFDLNPPEIVKAATKSYREENDQVGDFISECCALSDTAEAPAGKLYKAYDTWCKEMGHKPWNGKRFGQDVQRRFDKETRRHKTYYVGIGIIDENKVEKKQIGAKDFDVFSDENDTTT